MNVRFTVNASLAASAALLLIAGAAATGEAASGAAFSFSPARVALSLPDVEKTAAGDFNSDGKPDLAVTRRDLSGPNVQVLLGDGGGGFQAQSPLVVGATTSGGLAAGDFDGDGRADLAVGVYGLGVRILLSTKGGFGPASAFGHGIYSLRDIATGDFNGDGNLDLAATDADGVSLLLGDGAGAFSVSSKTPLPAIWDSSVRAADLNGDGSLDVVATGRRAGSSNDFDTVYQPWVALGNGNGGLTPFTPLPVLGDFQISAAVADVNGDGNLDVAATRNLGSNPDRGIDLLLGDGTGGFGPPIHTSLPFAVGVAAGDLNGDRKADLVVTAPNIGYLYGLVGAGDGTFSAHLLDATDRRGVLIQDLNGDRAPDVAITDVRFGSPQVLILINQGQFNGAPTASAGADQVVEAAGTLTPVALDGSASSDPDGDPLTYEWRKGGTLIATGPQPTVSLSIGVHSLELTVRDPLGQTGTDTVVVEVEDTTAPAIAVPADVTVEATTAQGAVVSYAASAQDAVDGTVPVTGAPGSGSQFPLGPSRVTLTATDQAENTATRTFTVRVVYAWSSVLQPVNANGTSLFKGGSTVPVKFRLTGASAGITDATARLYCARISDGIAGTEEEAVSTAAATPGNLFRYDASSGHYLFNLSTKELAPGTYRLRIDLGDGVERAVIVSLK